jgi:hypothetical protein
MLPKNGHRMTWRRSPLKRGMKQLAGVPGAVDRWMLSIMLVGVVAVVAGVFLLRVQDELAGWFWPGLPFTLS